MSQVLKVVPFTSIPDATFWHELTRKTLNIYKLDDTPTPLWVEKHFSILHDFILIATPLTRFLKLWEQSCGGHCLIIVDLKILKKVISQPFLTLFVTRYGQIFLLKMFLRILPLFCFPALILSEDSIVYQHIMPITEYLPAPNLKTLIDSFSALHYKQRTFFVIDLITGTAHPLHGWQDLVREEKLVVGYCDPCGNPHAPGWPIRNVVATILCHCSPYVQTVDIVCYREEWKSGVCMVEHGIVVCGLKVFSLVDINRPLKIVGWERNVKNKLAWRVLDLSSTLDPKKIAETACFINLSLMKWRLLPSLDIDKLFAVKCLIIGAGTLGCNVSRCLLAWGITHVTFVDNGKVSLSNPTRQTLFDFKDSMQGGKCKAYAAAEALKRIYPNCQSRGYEITVPMPGHAIAIDEVDSTLKDFKLLEELVIEHDAIFLLTDSRESRWLPTVLCQAHDKICMNAALGFDSFVVMRHGNYDTPIKKRLSCYFCSDVVAPVNSFESRTLDQQCTVTRPGLSFIASALTVELFVSFIQYPESNEVEETPLGIVPHQIRGFLSLYNLLISRGEAFSNCVACSEKVLQAFRDNKEELLLKCCNDALYLEEITELAYTKENIDQFFLDSDLDDNKED
ncbi:ubiquitin-like modifier-activating enzyme ATG7 isoform X3 [Zophobas morio]|uniref:ubiquitin-like modifier-activating enzyme ATG7 isoform X3 n=1 Tax=Zophobas morio TaxID=2755281 RepID=UPI003083696C